MAKPESYQAVVLAGGRGNRMINLTDYLEKSLLPVANIPMFWFPLNMLYRNGFRDCLLIVNESIKEKVNNLLSGGTLPDLPGFSVNVVAPIEEEEQDDLREWGTADVLRHFKDKITKEDIIIVSGDLVTDFSLDKMLEFHHSNGSVLTCLLTDSPLNGSTPGPKGRQKKYRDFVVLSQENNQLFFLSDEEDFGGDAEECSFSDQMFYCQPQLGFHAKYKDVHVYLTKKSVLEILDHKDFSSLKADLIPYILEGQYSKSVSCRKSFISTTTAAEGSENDRYRCFAYLARKEDATIIAQCNNVGSYFETNKTIPRLLTKLSSNISAGRRFEKSADITVSESRVGEDVVVKGEKSQVKRSIVGEGSTIGPGVKIDNSVLMSGVNVQKGSLIKNCIILPNVEVGENADLNMCVVASGLTIRPKEKIFFTIVHPEKEMSLEE